MQNDFISLSELNGLIREVIEMNFVEDIWLVAEIAEIRIAGAGHCYLELVEKKNNKIVARMRANIWSFQYQRISNNFFKSTGSTLQKGMKVLLSCGVSFHELYGASLVVKNVDPSYSLGDLERRKQEILLQLKNENLLERNGLLELEMLPKRIAVISSESAAGYGDFVNQIQNNSQRYIIECELFHSTMQGDVVGSSITKSLQAIQARLKDFDCVAIIRGGGAALDLAGFDNFELAKNIANFPLPVITGIGHERDDTVIDHVAHTKVKTPTALAEFILEKFLSFDEFISGLKDGLVYLTRDRVAKQKIVLKKASHIIKYETQKKIEKERLKMKTFQSKIELNSKEFTRANKVALKNIGNSILKGKGSIFRNKMVQLNVLKQRISLNAKSILVHQKTVLKLHEKTVELIRPENVLKRGYSIVYQNHKIVKSVQGISDDQEIEVKMKDGIITTKIIKNGK